jgi:ABC-2 type transport system ATP-binding protein
MRLSEIGEEILNMEDKMITLKNVCKNLKGVRVLRDINLTFQKKECVFLRGQNGSGKTMLLRLLCGLIRPSDGEIIADGKYRYGVIIENPTFLNGETALYNLKYLAGINNLIGLREIEKALRSVNLYEYRNKKVRTFSLGMKQRLAICQATMENPDVILLDEPFNAIDEINLKAVMEILHKQKSIGKLLVVASHGDIPINGLFTRTIEMNAGGIMSDSKI